MPHPYDSIYVAKPLEPTRKLKHALPPGDRYWTVHKKVSGVLRLKGVFGPHKTAYFARQEASTVLNMEPWMLVVRVLERKQKK
jgi:hypothetical protein